MDRAGTPCAVCRQPARRPRAACPSRLSYDQPAIALNCGAALRDAVRHESVAAAVLQSPSLIARLFECVEAASFEVASDAFATFKARRVLEGWVG